MRSVTKNQNKVRLKNLAKAVVGGMGSLYRSQHELLPLFKKGTAAHVFPGYHMATGSLQSHGRDAPPTALCPFATLASFYPNEPAAEVAGAGPARWVKFTISPIVDFGNDMGGVGLLLRRH